MKRHKVKRTVAAALAVAATVAVAGSTVYAWSWGVEDLEEYEFNPQYRAEILKYGCQVGPDWRAEISNNTYASSENYRVKYSAGPATNQSGNNWPAGQP